MIRLYGPKNVKTAQGLMDAFRKGVKFVGMSGLKVSPLSLPKGTVVQLVSTPSQMMVPLHRIVKGRNINHIITNSRVKVTMICT